MNKRNLKKNDGKQEPFNETNLSPYDTAGFFSKATFSWMSPYVNGFAIGRRNNAGTTTPALPKLLDPQSVLAQFEVERKRIQTNYAKRISNTRLMTKTMWNVYRMDVIVMVLLLTLAGACWIVIAAVWIRRLVIFSQSDSSFEKWKGYAYATGLIFTEMVRSVSIQNFWFRSSRLGCEIKTLVYALTFDRSVNMAWTNVGVGEMVNLCSNDGDRLFECARMILTIYLSIFLLTAITIVGYGLVGPAIFAGSFTVVLLIPAQLLFAGAVGRERKKGVAYTHERVGIMTELITDIKLVKMYDWERAFGDKVAAIRKKEKKHLVCAARFSSVMISLNTVVPTLASVLVFVVKVGLGDGRLTAQDAFAVVSLFNTLQMPLVTIPMAVRSLAEARVGLSRLGKLFGANEYFEPPLLPNDRSLMIEIEDGTFDWNKNVEKKKTAPKDETKDNQESLASMRHVLVDVNIRVRPKQLIGVCGPIGSGKSSLCHALIGGGGIDCVCGSVGIRGTVAYASQLPWILPNTIRENVLFGSPYDAERYKRTVHACRLKRDLEDLPSGDLTLVGERGVNLSGGQKQRVALARAVYAEKDIYILDDPLSAVDPRVGRGIFDDCIKKMLKEKTVVFVTHHLGFLAECDSIVFLENERSITGQYDEMIKTSDTFHSFTTSLKQTEKEREEGCEYEEKLQIEVKTKRFFGEEGGNLVAKKRVDPNPPRLLHGVEHRHSNKKYASESVSKPPCSDTGKYDISNVSPSVNDSPNTSLSLNSNIGDEHTSSSENRRDNKKQFSWQTVQAFAEAGDGLLVFMLVLLLFFVTVGGRIFNDRWLALWISKGDGTLPNGNLSDNPNLHVNLVVYLGSAFGIILLHVVRAWCYNRYMLQASTSLHDKLVRALLCAPLCFFDTKPLGEILARISKDIDEIDVRIPTVLEMFLLFACLILLTLFLISALFPYFTIALPFIVVMSVVAVRRFTPAQNRTKYIETTSAGPVLSHMVASLEGMATVQAFGAQQSTLTEFWRRFNKQAGGFFYFYGVQSWAAYRLDLVSLCVVSVAGLLVPATRGNVEPGLTGLVLAYANGLSGLWQAATRLGTEAATRLTSVERINDYLNNVPKENQPGKRRNSKVPAKDWPAKGNIDFDIVSASYQPHLPPVLRDVRFSVSHGEKIGVVGRTGSGKSSLCLCLFRLIAELQGTVYIDGVDTADVSLHDLRSSLGVVPQDPVLFQGTIRYNLDPFMNHDDDALWNSLRRARIDETVASLPEGLSTIMGSNLSVGERQLLCLARILLRSCRIVVLDEATSAIDSRTDEVIQKTVRKEFASCTVLTIAHRVETILDSDRILVLDGGRVIEYDTPDALLKKKNSIFGQMVQA